MNFIKRAFRNIVYKKAYNFILVILFTVLATLILSGLAISKASAQSCAAVRRELGGSVTMYNAKDMAAGIPLQTAQSVEKLAYVQSSNFYAEAKAYAYDFKAIGDPLSGFKDKLKAVDSDIMAEGVTQTAKLSSLSNGKYKLVEGRNLDKNDLNQQNALIEKILAQSNKLKIGSRITLQSTSGSKEKITFIVIGIYQNTDQEEQSADPLNQAGNTVYIPYTQAQKLADVATIQRAAFFMDDPINIDSFKASASKLLGNGYTLDAQDATYRRMAGSLSGLIFFSGIMVYGVVILGAVILSLIVMLSLKNRKFEIGVLLSVGERKAKIISQMVVEILVPVIIACSISIATGAAAAQQVGNIMLQSENQVQQSMPDNTVKDYKTGKEIKAVQNINVNIEASELLVLYAAGISIALLSSVIPVIFVLRYNPGKMLQDKE